MTTPTEPETTAAPLGAERLSVAMTNILHDDLTAHLIRHDGQEDLCFATYKPSTGTRRWTGLLRTTVLPEDGEREVHGNASFTGDYVLRAAALAAQRGEGLALLHSHPRGSGWQQMSREDADTEQSYARLVRTSTGLPLLGLTLAGDTRTWSARAWNSDGTHRWCESTRVVGPHLRVCWNDRLRPEPPLQDSQIRTVSAWGEQTQADVARLRVLVVGTGSVGLDVVQRLAATGLEHVGVMDFDVVEVKNLDRMIGATREDAAAGRAKTEVALRLMKQAATAAAPSMTEHDLSICEPSGHSAALDYDVIISCVDRPWPRAVLNVLAYADLIPVIDGGISIDTFDASTGAGVGGGMRNATWRTHVLRPGRPCMVCNEQLEPASVNVDRQGLLDDPGYIAGTGRGAPQRQNVAALAASVSASLLNQFVALTVAPSGRGETGHVRYALNSGWLEILTYTSTPGCRWENAAVGDDRQDMAGPHLAAEQARSDRAQRTTQAAPDKAPALDTPAPRVRLADSARNRLPRLLRLRP